MSDPRQNRETAQEEFFFSLKNAVGKLVPDGGTVVQIGANDGVTADPIHTYIRNKRLHGLLVEPLPHLMGKLQKNYQGCDNLQFAHTAVTDDPAQTTLTMLRYNTQNLKPGKELPFYAELVAQVKGAATQSSNAIANREDAEGKYIEEEVPASCLEPLLQKHGIGNIDLLQIDVEGFDYTVLKQFDFKNHGRPAIHFEYVHLPPEQKNAAKEFLANNGYAFALTNGRDMLAVPKEKMHELLGVGELSEETRAYIEHLQQGNSPDEAADNLAWALALTKQTACCLASRVFTGSTANLRDPVYYVPAMRDTGGTREPDHLEALDGLHRICSLFINTEITNNPVMHNFLADHMPSDLTKLLDVVRKSHRQSA